MRHHLTVAALLGLLCGLWSPGCAAIVASRTDTLNVNSNPQGAEIRLNGTVTGRTPAAVQVTRMAPESVEVVAPGYDPQRCPVSMTAGGGYIAGDVLFCVLLFPIGCISWIDAAGYWNTLVSPNCSVTLNPTPVPAQPVAPPPVVAPQVAPTQQASPAPAGNPWPAADQIVFIRYCVEANSATVKGRTRDLCSCALDDMQIRYPNTSLGLTTDHALPFKVKCAQKMGVPQSAVR